MDPLCLVPMLEVTGLSSSNWGEHSMDVPIAMEGLQGSSPPPFLGKICDLVGDPETNHIVSWSKGNNSFVIWDPEAFAIQLLPKYFKHSNLSSFIRQLNTYGFKKVDHDKLEFASEWFLRGQGHLLKQIRRKKPSHPQNSLKGPTDSCAEIVQFEPKADIDRLRSDRQVLRVELVRLRQELQNTKAHLKAIERRLRESEIKQHHIMGFLVRIMQNPSFLKQLVQRGRWSELVEAFSKNSWAVDQDYIGVEVRELGQDWGRHYVKQGTKDFGDIKVPEVNKISTEMEVIMETSKDSEKRQDGENRGLDRKFWEELLNNRNEEESDSLGVKVGEENRDMPADQIDFWHS